MATDEIKLELNLNETWLKEKNVIVDSWISVDAICNKEK